MPFTDIFFLGYFLPAFLLLARLLSLRGFGLSFRLLLIVGTLVFYGFENISWVWIFAAVAMPGYAAGLFVTRAKTARGRQAWLAAGITVCVSALCVFKYLNWFSTLLPALIPLREWVADGFGENGQIVLPPGISFYVFEAISFQVDLYRHRFPLPRFLNYANFICLFPRFIAGPIVRYTDVQAELQSWPGMKLHRGLLLFALGFCLKVSFADQFAKFVPYAFGPIHPDLLQALVGSVAYSFQLYFDFWGYSVMAMGLGLCLGFSFPDNFLRPYAAVSVTDFWRRWHVTLSSWLRDYLYIPLGGNRHGTGRRYFNLLLTMTLAGLWHGASTVFLLWGLYHGLLLVGEKLAGVDPSKSPGRSPAMRIYCLIAVLLGWILFRASSLTEALDVFSGLTGLHGFASQFNSLFFERHMFSAIMMGFGLLFCLFGERRLMTGPRGGLFERQFTKGETWAIYAAFAFSLTVRFGEEGVPFLYFKF